jgi:hypothetical protein
MSPRDLEPKEHRPQNGTSGARKEGELSPHLAFSVLKMTPRWPHAYKEKSIHGRSLHREVCTLVALEENLVYI